MTPPSALRLSLGSTELAEVRLRLEEMDMDEFGDLLGRAS
jgi:hypothetical protein